MAKRKGAMSEFAKKQGRKRKELMVQRILSNNKMRGSRIRAANPDAGQPTDLGNP